MSNKKNSIPRYSISNEKIIFEQIGIDINEFDKKILHDIKNDLDIGANKSEIINATCEYVFKLLESNEKIKFPHITSKLSSYLREETKHKIQDIIKNFSSKRQSKDFECFRGSDYYPSCLFWKMYNNKFFQKDKKEFMQKVYYGFSFLLLRDLTDEEKEILTKFNWLYSNYYNDVKAVIEHKEPSLKYIETAYNMDYIESCFNLLGKYVANSTDYEILYNILLDVSLRDIVYLCLGNQYIECNKNTMTYKELIENHLFDCTHDLYDEKTEQAIYQREEDSFRKHIKKYIFANDNEEVYYRKFRGTSKYKNKTFCSCEKDFYNLIYLFYERRSPKTDKNGIKKIPEEVVKSYYHSLYQDLLKEYPTSQKIHSLSSISKWYKKYLNHIILHKPLNKTSNKIKDCSEMIRFHNIILEALSNSNNRWYNMTSMFISSWDFIQTAAYVYCNRILKRNTKTTEKSYINYNNKFIQYCYEINNIKLSKTQKLLLEDERFFNSYLEYPSWIEEFKSTLRYEEIMTKHIFTSFCNLKKIAFDNSEEELKLLHDNLSTYEYKNPQHEVKDYQLEIFLKEFLPKKE